ncbi:hypothetical protein H2200_010738 [Cladophialophora chaetospira]|uniref:Uncharacterized protein n=1 Tax=Cladophialophora chaetospira TaxID=386627 RepID=A0AA39CDV3_9EURO|nr:hypothetical protein H2200_010738 [Cladophialophora chaetospira]
MDHPSPNVEGGPAIESTMISIPSGLAAPGVAAKSRNSSAHSAAIILQGKNTRIQFLIGGNVTELDLHESWKGCKLGRWLGRAGATSPRLLLSGIGVITAKDTSTPTSAIGRLRFNVYETQSFVAKELPFTQNPASLQFAAWNAVNHRQMFLSSLQGLPPIPANDIALLEPDCRFHGTFLPSLAQRWHTPI